MLKNSNVWQSLFKGLRMAACPVLGELPLLLCFLFVNNLYDWIALVRVQDLTGGGKSLLIGFLLSYLLASISFLVNRNWLRGLFYVAGFFILVVQRFLFLKFSIIIGPETLQLLMQTNKGEATEFLSTYVFSIDNAVYLFSFLLMCSLAAGVERLYAKYRVAFLENTHLRFYIGSVSVVCLLLAMPLLYSYSFVFSVRDTDALNEGIATKAVCKKDPISLMVYAMASLHTEKIELARVAQRCKEASSQCSYIVKP